MFRCFVFAVGVDDIVHERGEARFDVHCGEKRTEEKFLATTDGERKFGLVVYHFSRAEEHTTVVGVGHYPVVGLLVDFLSIHFVFSF